MNPHPARKPSLYEQLMALPDGLTGEIINGQLRTQPRPAWPHGLAGSRLGADIEGPYGRGRGGPGGWWIIDEPEVHFVLDTEVTVPDIAGWRKDGMPSPPEGHKIQVVPDWVCEIFSPATRARTERRKCRFTLAMASDSLGSSTRRQKRWRPLGIFRDDDTVSVAPFDAIAIRLADLWA
jgi:Uma2 family endonuclease